MQAVALACLPRSDQICARGGCPVTTRNRRREEIGTAFTVPKQKDLRRRGNEIRRSSGPTSLRRLIVTLAAAPTGYMGGLLKHAQPSSARRTHPPPKPGMK
jgi:hypothetical protein